MIIYYRTLPSSIKILLDRLLEILKDNRFFPSMYIMLQPRKHFKISTQNLCLMFIRKPQTLVDIEPLNIVINL